MHTFSFFRQNSTPYFDMLTKYQKEIATFSTWAHMSFSWTKFSSLSIGTNCPVVVQRTEKEGIGQGRARYHRRRCRARPPQPPPDPPDEAAATLHVKLGTADVFNDELYAFAGRGRRHRCLCCRSRLLPREGAM